VPTRLSVAVHTGTTLIEIVVAVVVVSWVTRVGAGRPDRTGAVTTIRSRLIPAQGADLTARLTAAVPVEPRMFFTGPWLPNLTLASFVERVVWGAVAIVVVGR
jgi:hypothetical protein